MSVARHHADWLNLIEINGPFLSLPVLMRVFPQGLPAFEAETNKNLRLAFETWDDNKEEPAPLRQWVQYVLQTLLEIPRESWKEGQSLPPGLEAPFPEYGETLRPDLVLVAPTGEGKQAVRLLVQIATGSRDLNAPLPGRRWKASPATRMVELLHATGALLGLVTNGRQWMLVYAPAGETSGFITWYSHLWIEEQITLRAFRALFHCSRFFSVPEPDTLAGLLKESAQDQQEVTDQLGRQVRKAVEVLVQAFDWLDHEAGGNLLEDIQPAVLYEAVLTVMMRLVFLFSAEERDLLRLGEPLYDDNYAVSTLRDQLRETADRFGEEVLERRFDAWGRLLAAFRVVHGGVEHESLRLPPYGGTLFDPDRYPFLEGRKTGSSWKNDPSHPPAINNRVVLHLMESLQTLQLKVPGSKATETRKLSFRGLDIEQIGHVYEGLLDHTAVRATETVLGLVGAKNQEEEIPLHDLEEHKGKGIPALVTFLHDTTGRSEKTLEKLFSTFSEAAPYGKKETQARARLQTLLPGNSAVRQQVEPYIDLVREDSFGMPLVIEKGRIYVTCGATRRSTGTHYTPRSLTEPIVLNTLEPLVYRGPAEGWPKEKWELKKPAEILDLKVCDMAMGSGAFLVQACRYLSERLVESWEIEEQAHPGKQVVSPDGTLSSGKPDERLIPRDLGERLAIARRAVVDRCLYGVDINPMAVEMAKLSMWLITMQRDRPFTFLDHAFKCGDSLLGVSSLEQIERFSLRPGERQATFAMKDLKKLVDDAATKRRALEALPSNDYAQVEEKNRLHAETQEATAKIKQLADFLIAFELRGLDGTAYAEQRFDEAEKVQLLLKPIANASPNSQPTSINRLSACAREQLRGRRPFHWSVEFPEVFSRGGFDAFVGNPPFMGGLKVVPTFGKDYRDYLFGLVANGVVGVRGTSDLCSFFFLRAHELLAPKACCGFLATNTIAQGDTRETGLDQLHASTASIYRALTNFRWPGSAALYVSVVHFTRMPWNGQRFLDAKRVPNISPYLSASHEERTTNPHELVSNEDIGFQGPNVCGLGFTLSLSAARQFIDSDSRNAEVLFPYLIGNDLNTNYDQSVCRWIINFFDWPLKGTQDGGGHCASDYPPVLAILEAAVKPERKALPPTNHFNKAAARSWWQYGGPRHALYKALRQVKRTLVTATVSPTNAVSWMPSKMVFDKQVVCFPIDDDGFFAVMQSSFHWAWAWAYSSTLGSGTLRYSPTNCSATFPLPQDFTLLRPIGECYCEGRKQIMLCRKEGLTSIYNRFHDRGDQSEDIARLRALHEEMDQTVAAAYDWSDLDLGHGFHETKQGVRYTISESARRTVLDRLLALNHQRYEEEVKAGLHDKKKPATKARKKKPDPVGATRRVAPTGRPKCRSHPRQPR